jgi:hypothetical protein
VIPQPGSQVAPHSSDLGGDHGPNGRTGTLLHLIISWTEALAGDLAPYLNAVVRSNPIVDFWWRPDWKMSLQFTKSGFLDLHLMPSERRQEVEYVMAGGKWPPRHDDAPELGRERLTDPNPLPSPPRLS